MRTITFLAAVLCFGALGAGIALGVTGGEPDYTHTYVGMIVQQQTHTTSTGPVTGTEIYTGFLYDETESRLATAAHCFPDGSTVYVNFDQSPPPPNFVDGVPTTPGWIPGFVHDDTTDYCPNCGQSGGPVNDVAVVHIPAQPLGYAQLPAPGSDASLPNGDPIDVVGYGVQAVSKKTGVTACCSRQVTTTGLKNVTKDYLKLLADPGACEGDSGGPDLQHGTNLALAINTFSNGNPNCNGVTYSVRLDNPTVQAFLISG